MTRGSACLKYMGEEVSPAPNVEKARVSSTYKSEITDTRFTYVVKTVSQ